MVKYFQFRNSGDITVNFLYCTLDQDGHSENCSECQEWIKFETGDLKNGWTYGIVSMEPNSITRHSVCPSHIMIGCFKTTEATSSVTVDDLNNVFSYHSEGNMQFVVPNDHHLIPVALTIDDGSSKERSRSNQQTKSRSSETPTLSRMASNVAMNFGAKVAGDYIHDQFVNSGAQDTLFDTMVDFFGGIAF
ncbi:hypothetical protein BC833DRAFT_624200 [Globomyces pollinis-pini]|nr:hypothetical protein BC833DRAFT_624200 [Globomyces pollinis-pini]